MTIYILEKLFGSNHRVKVMKFFLFNPNQIFEIAQIGIRTKVSHANLLKELRILIEAGLIRKKIFHKVSANSKRKSKKQGYILNNEFALLAQLQNLLINSQSIQNNDIVRRINRVGKIKLLVLSGVFIQATETRLDILIVGDEIKERLVKKVVGNIESDIGKELRYAILSTSDYKYRYNVCDRLVRDVFDYPHEVIVDRLGL